MPQSTQDTLIYEKGIIMNNFLYSITAAMLITSSITGMYSDSEKVSLITQKLSFYDTQKEAFNRINIRNKFIYKQAEDVAQYILGDVYETTKQQIKSAVNQILESQEFMDYHHYCVMLKTPLIGRDNMKVKDIPVIRPDHALSKKINDILAATVPVKLLQQVEVLSYFETYLNYKIDLVESQVIVAKLHIVEDQMVQLLDQLENNEIQ